MSEALLARFRYGSRRSTINFEIAAVLAQITGNGETFIAALYHFARL
jgi:hypothetical protein